MPSSLVTATKPRAHGRRHAAHSDVRDFLLLSVFVTAFMTACYLALWKPFLAQWIS